jgi:hypothetical protein
VVHALLVGKQRVNEQVMSKRVSNLLCGVPATRYLDLNTSTLEAFSDPPQAFPGAFKQIAHRPYFFDY